MLDTMNREVYTIGRLDCSLIEAGDWLARASGFYKSVLGIESVCIIPWSLPQIRGLSLRS